jgi:hypothetical protein
VRYLPCVGFRRNAFQGCSSYAGKDADETITVGTVTLPEQETSGHPGYPHEVVTHTMHAVQGIEHPTLVKDELRFWGSRRNCAKSGC